MTYITDKSYMIREEEEINHLLRIKADFKYFFYWVCTEALLGSRDLFIPNRGFDLLSEYLTDWLDGNQRRLAIAIPPRNLKSQMFSVAAPMFQWLTNPSETFISVSHHDDVLDQFMSARKSVFLHPDYQRASEFTLTVCKSDTFRNSSAGHILSMVMGHVKTGLGGRYIIVDDPIAAKDGENSKFCEKVWQLYTGTLMSRMDDKKFASMAVISQRVGDADIVGRVAEIGYNLVKLQAIASKEIELVFPISGIKWTREVDDILNPEYEPIEVLMDIKRANERAWFSQYQQEPVTQGNGTFSFSSIATYEKPQEKYNEIILSADTAASINKGASNWGLCVFGKYLKGGFTHLDLLFAHAHQYEYPQGRAKMVELIDRFGVTVTLIEDKSTGLSLIPSLSQEGFKVIAIKPTKSKEDRAMMCAAFIEGGRLLVPCPIANPWSDRFMTYFKYELEGFPFAKTRDLLDSTTQAINEYNSKNFDARMWYGVSRP